jgi:hypothetical protein
MLLRLKKNAIKKCIMPAKSAGKPLVAEFDKERCSATTKESTRCQLVKSVGSHFCLVHVAKNTVKAGKKTVQAKVEAPRRMATRSTPA